MTQGIEARTETTAVSTAAGVARSLAAESRLWLGVSGIALAAAVFLLHQLMAWPPHEDETLALFVGRDSLAGGDRARDTGARRRTAALPPRVGRRAPRVRSRRSPARLSRCSRSRACRSWRCSALRLGGRRVALVATALVAPSWLFLFHGVYGRMYSVFLFFSLACSLALLQALERGGRGRWALWVATALLTVATHPYAVLLLAGQGAFVLVAARDRLREAVVAGARGARPRPPVLAHRSRARRTLRRRRRRRRREARRARRGCALPVALAR